MGYRSKDYILIKKLKYAVLDKKTNILSILPTQKSVTEMVKVSRSTIYRGLPYENSEYAVYSIKMKH